MGVVFFVACPKLYVFVSVVLSHSVSEKWINLVFLAASGWGKGKTHAILVDTWLSMCFPFPPSAEPNIYAAGPDAFFSFLFGGGDKMTACGGPLLR